MVFRSAAAKVIENHAADAEYEAYGWHRSRVKKPQNVRTSSHRSEQVFVAERIPLTFN